VIEDTAQLEREVRYLHDTFFRRELPPQMVERYIAAHAVCLPVNPSAGSRIERGMISMVTRRLDVEAIELAMRWRRLDTLLMRKIQILFYLVEVRADYYGYFINQDSGRARAWLALAGSVVGSLWKFVKGTYLIWRYGLV
jgi:hypothetical protein